MRSETLATVIPSPRLLRTHDISYGVYIYTFPIQQLLAVYAFMGGVFAWLYWRTGTLWAPIAAHALNNALALLVHGFG